MKVLIHPGFHKTGTTTLQRTLAANRAALADRLTVFTPDDLRPLAAISRRMSVAPGPGKDARLASTFRTLLDSRPDIRSRNLLLSCEDLSGLIPWRRDLWSYHAAAQILDRLVRTSRACLGPEVEHIVFFTTRPARAWCKSTYWQNLRSERITMSLQDYETRLLADCDLGDTVRRVRAALAPEVTVRSVDVTQGEHPLGPLAEMLALLGVKPDGIRAEKAQNVQPPDGIEDLLRLNRSELSDAALARRKRAYLDALRSRRKPSRSTP